MKSQARLSIISNSSSFNCWCEEQLSHFGVSLSLSVNAENDNFYQEFVKLGHNESIDMILCVVHSILPAQFLDSLRNIPSQKPVICLKIGNTFTGKRSYFSEHHHSFSQSLFHNICSQGFALYADDSFYFLGAVVTLAKNYHLNLSGNQLAVISTSSTIATMVSDTAESLGLDVPLFTEQTENTLKKVIPNYLFSGNPLVLKTDTNIEAIARCMKVILSDPMIAAMVLILPQSSFKQILQINEFAFSDIPKPIFPILFDLPSDSSLKKDSAYTILSTVEQAIYGVKTLHTFLDYKQKKSEYHPIQHDLQKNHDVTNVKNDDPIQLFCGYGFQKVLQYYLNDIQSIDTLTKNNDTVFNLQLILNESSFIETLDLVKSGLSTNQEIQAAYQAFESRFSHLYPRQYLLREMLDPSLEMLIFGKMSRTEGAIITIQLGGDFSLIYKDTFSFVPPAHSDDIMHLFQTLQGYSILIQPKFSDAFEKLCLCISRLSFIFEDYPSILDSFHGRIHVSEKGVFIDQASVIASNSF